MNTARLRLSKRSVIALALPLVGMIVWPAVQADGQQARQSGVERFLLISDDPNSTHDQPVLGFGPIHARGIDHVINDTHDVFKFPAGNLKLTHTPKKTHNFSDPVTCLFRYTERGTYRITGGTRAYAGASGHGHYRLAAKGIGCHKNAAPKVFIVTINGRGPLNLS
jgi:hypothetical protein